MGNSKTLMTPKVIQLSESYIFILKYVLYNILYTDSTQQHQYCRYIIYCTMITHNGKASFKKN